MILYSLLRPHTISTSPTVVPCPERTVVCVTRTGKGKGKGKGMWRSVRKTAATRTAREAFAKTSSATLVGPVTGWRLVLRRTRPVFSHIVALFHFSDAWTTLQIAARLGQPPHPYTKSPLTKLVSAAKRLGAVKLSPRRILHFWPKSLLAQQGASPFSLVPYTT